MKQKADEAFKIIEEARSVLIDPAKRSEYDLTKNYRSGQHQRNVNPPRFNFHTNKVPNNQNDRTPRRRNRTVCYIRILTTLGLGEG